MRTLPRHPLHRPRSMVLGMLRVGVRVTVTDTKMSAMGRLDAKLAQGHLVLCWGRKTRKSEAAKKKAVRIPEAIPSCAVKKYLKKTSEQHTVHPTLYHQFCCYGHADAEQYATGEHRGVRTSPQEGEKIVSLSRKLGLKDHFLGNTGLAISLGVLCRRPRASCTKRSMKFHAHS